MFCNYGIQSSTAIGVKRRPKFTVNSGGNHLALSIAYIGVAALQTMVRLDCRRTVLEIYIIHAQVEIQNYNY